MHLLTVCLPIDGGTAAAQHVHGNHRAAVRPGADPDLIRVFVAVSVAPERFGGHDADFQVKAGIAFAALVNGLVIGLIACSPAITSRSPPPSWRAAGSSAIGLGAISFRHAHLGQPFRALYRIAGLLALFVVQLVNSLQLGPIPITPDRSACKPF